MGNGDDTLFFGDQVTQRQVQTRIENFGATGIAVFGADQFQLFADHFHQARCAVQDADQLADLIEDFLVLAQQLLVLETGQAVQTQFQNGLSLFRRQEILAFTQTVLRIEVLGAARVGTGTLDHLDHCARFPRRLDQRFLGFGRCRRGLDEGDDRIDVGQRNGLTFKDVATLARFAQFEHGTTGHHFAAVTNEGFQQILEVQDARTTVDQGNDVDTENALQLGLGVEVVEDNLRHFATT